jgi:hypothetical protein
MGSIEVGYITIGAVILLIGLARTYVKELGATIIILVAIFLLTFPEEQIIAILDRVGTAFYDPMDPGSLNRFKATVFSLLFTIIVYAGYAGNTLHFRGKPVRQPASFFISFLVGLVNGYLIAGTLWYYQNTFDYPWYAQFVPEFTETAQRLIDVLPPSLFENPVLWIVPVAILLLIRVRG